MLPLFPIIESGPLLNLPENDPSNEAASTPPFARLAAIFCAKVILGRLPSPGELLLLLLLTLPFVPMRGSRGSSRRGGTYLVGFGEGEGREGALDGEGAATGDGEFFFDDFCDCPLDAGFGFDACCFRGLG